MELSGEEQRAVALCLAASGEDAATISKSLSGVCGDAAIPIAAVQTLVQV